MKRLLCMKEALMDCVMCQISDLEHVNTQELGEAIDMIKDLEEAIYYSTITKAMEGKENGASSTHYGTADELHSRSNSHHQESIDMRDPREGRSYMSRRLYLESKETGKDKLSNIQDLEHYLKELSEDIIEMVENASPEERQLAQKKLNMLAQKIVGT